MKQRTGRPRLGLVPSLRDVRLSPEADAALAHLALVTGLSKASLARAYVTSGLIRDGILPTDAAAPLTQRKA